jgi:hypothetical protein
MKCGSGQCTPCSLSRAHLAPSPLHLSAAAWVGGWKSMSGRGVSVARKVGFGRASRKIWMGYRRGGECRNPAGGNEAKRDEFLKRG